MDPVIFEFLGGLLVGGMTGLMVVLRNRQSPREVMPMLAIRSPRSASSTRRRRNSKPTEKGSSTLTVARKSRRGKNKTPEVAAASDQTPVTVSAATTISFDTCPSCGLQAPGSLLTEHFLGSPSHRNGPPKIVEADPVEVEAAAEAEEEDSKQSVRNLLQMLVPPRAFGRRHAYKSLMPISPIVKNLGPAQGRIRRL